MNGKRTTARLTRQVIYHALRDRQWHRVEELMDSLSILVSPEAAAKSFRKRTKNADLYSESHAVEHGRKLVISDSISSAVSSGRVDVAGPPKGPDRRLRLDGWFCASCGTYVDQPWDDRPSHSICKSCIDGGTPCDS